MCCGPKVAFLPSSKTRFVAARAYKSAVVKTVLNIDCKPFHVPKVYYQLMYTIDVYVVSIDVSID